MNGQLRRDWRQFRLLSKDAVRQLIDAALLSRDSDPTRFVIWLLALIATPTLVYAMRQIFVYISLTNAPDPLVHQIALQHRLFFITYGMLSAALLAALVWEAVFPDGRDQEIVGVLPVRPYVFAAWPLRCPSSPSSRSTIAARSDSINPPPGCWRCRCSSSSSASSASARAAAFPPNSTPTGHSVSLDHPWAPASTPRCC